MPPGTARLDVLRTGIGCGLNLPSGDPSRARLEPLASLGERIASDDGQAALADDRSDLFDDVVSAWQALGRLEDAKRVALVWAAFVEREAGLAASPASRAVFDAHRVAASIAAGDPQRALEPLERSERDFPGDYNPPARLGRVLMALGRYGEADAALSRALALAYGPRRLNLGSTLADVRLARGDRSGARRALESALASAGGTPLPGSYPKLRDALAQRLAELSP
jgi:tetratricopeptide (TPR) repeat protein